jgi:hypothetical protein
MQYDDDVEESNVTNKIEKDGFCGERPKVAQKPQLRTGAREGASDMIHAKEKFEQEAEEEEFDDFDDPMMFIERQDANGQRDRSEF